ncbi:hypothetical protein [Pseudonocardia sp. TRM90224]|uniref:hypothetical protein n=1 Tax=Pseudonocardia sp. TRM90224 TaxID=2812678 RepID=UPI001E5BE9F7|nr:hypothetical protein [Pseudonocardia sp. TRM90224]
MTKKAILQAGVLATLLTAGIVVGGGVAAADDSVRITGTPDSQIQGGGEGTDNCIYSEHTLGC